MQATYGITDIAYNYRPIMGGEERRELIYEGFVNYRLNQGDSEAEAKAYADGQIDNYAARPANGYADWEDALLKKGHQQDYSLSVSGGNEKSNFYWYVRIHQSDRYKHKFRNGAFYRSY